jgi:hypothetical protein
LPATVVAAAIPIIPVESDVVASTAVDADDTVVSFCSRLIVLPFDV